MEVSDPIRTSVGRERVGPDEQDMMVVGDDLWVLGGDVIARIGVDDGTVEHIEADPDRPPGTAGGPWTSGNPLSMWIWETV